MDFIRNLPKAFQPSKTLIPNKILTLTKPTEIYELFSRLTELITVWVFFDNIKIQSYIRLERAIFEDFWNPGEILEGPITALILGGFFFFWDDFFFDYCLFCFFGIGTGFYHAACPVTQYCMSTMQSFHVFSGSGC